MIFNPRSRTKAKVIHIIQRDLASILCFVKDDKVYSVRDSIEINTIKTNLKINTDDIVKIENGKIVEIIGNISDAKVDEKISLYLYNESYRLNDYELDNNVNLKDLEQKQRIDLTHLSFCTIDPASAKDHDDAIYFDEKQNILYVAIADISSFIKEGSSLDIKARKRAFSIYLPNKVLPMIPFELSNDLCSLKPDVERLAFVFKIKLDIQKLIVIKAEVFEATIKSQNKYSYEEIDKKIEDKKLPVWIDRLYSLTKKLRQKRLQNGFDFRTEELRLLLDENENLEDIKIETSSASHQLIEECMLLANCEAAKKLKGLGIFRVHDEPSAKKIEKLIDDVGMLGIKVKAKADIHKTIQSIQAKALNANLENEVDELIIQSQQQARYNSKSQIHFGLGFTDYSHFTSPIRRYADLVLHRILKNNKTKRDIEIVCEDISIKEREIASLVWDLEDRKYARWAKDNISEICEATIVDVADTIIVKLNNKMVGARIVCEDYQGQKLFSNVKIKIKSSNIISKEINGIIL
jgi:ribonuclease R